MFVHCLKKKREREEKLTDKDQGETIRTPKINQSNRALESPKLTVHLSEREVV